ncbi:MULTISPECIES: phage terminase small subunit P27 family [unclassified Streptomyces]|uniref:phage terminase small subunit P27 family n=1 Tax=unclassified Streptomyces TaxID=2593676 RepID=UPI003392B148
MARTAEPAKLRLLKGRSEGKDAAGREVNPGPAFKRIPPSAPEWLSEEAAAEWGRVLPGLARLELLKPEDRAALAAYCEAWATFRTASETVAREGLTIEAKQGTLAHPAVGIARAAGREMRAWAAHFGLTPSTEQGLARGSENEPDPDNPFG